MITTSKFSINPKNLAAFQQAILKKAGDAQILRNEFEEVKKIVKDRYFYHGKVTTSTQSDPKKFIFSENLNYFAAGTNSIWGNGDLETLAYLNSLSLSLSKPKLAECLRGGRQIQ